MRPAWLALFADAGIPMIVWTFPAMLMLFIPVTIIEAFLCKAWLRVTTWEAVKSNAISNLASTVFGIPLAWAVMFGVELVTFSAIQRGDAIHNWHSPLAQAILLLLGSSWIGPITNKSVWPVPAATLVLLAPFFLASYVIEYRVMKFMVGMPEGGPPNVYYSRVRIAVRNANLVTYGAIFIATAVWLILSLPKRG